ncbi:MAG TPA: endonuclease/exonuclease/phosphatase family protein, partial [Chroococcales cyanobacterium]
FGNGWRRRREALRRLLLDAGGDIICTQEGLRQQLDYIDEFLPEFGYVGVARDDGVSKGEHCAIYYNRSLLEELRCGTFWLSETPETYLQTWDGPFKRICTWMMVRTITAKAAIWVFNTHFPLNAWARPRAARLLLDKIQEFAGSEAIILAGDFNCGPRSVPWKMFHDSGLRNAQVALGQPLQNTQCAFGIPMFCLDGIFVSRDLNVLNCRVLDQSVQGIYPSDHFGILAEIDM